MKKIANKKLLMSVKMLVIFCIIFAVIFSGCVKNNGNEPKENGINIKLSDDTSHENNETSNASIETKQAIVDSENNEMNDNNSGNEPKENGINIKPSDDTSHENNETSNASIETKQVIINPEDGKSINLKKGDIFSLKLRENPSTGYSWQLNLSQGLTILSDEYTQDPAPEGQVGVPGNHSWEIRAVAEGNQQVKGIYKQPWVDTTGTEINFTLNAEVS